MAARYSAVLTALINRLTAHVAPAKLLAGYRLVTTPVKEVEGYSDIPSILLMPPSIDEKPRHPITLVDGTFTVRLDVATARDAGAVAHIQAVEKVMDGIELNDATLDQLLSATLSKPPEMKADGTSMTDQAITTQITIVTTPLTVRSGNRRGS
jgi:hypothetical protein